MIRGITASRSGMSWEQSRVDVIANNVANVNTGGFQRQIAVGGEFSQMLLYRMADQATQPVPVGRLGHGAELQAVVTDRSQPAIEQTDRPLDVALSGPGEFTYLGPGGPGYTRSGAFARDVAGRLVTAQGYPVLAGGRPVGEGAKVLQIKEDGTVLADGVAQGRLDMRGGNGAPLVVGALERSNVDLSLELTDMMVALRSYQANQRALSAQDETLAKAVSDIGRV